MANMLLTIEGHEGGQDEHSHNADCIRLGKGINSLFFNR